MFKLTVRAPDGTETSYSLGQDQGLIVGRDEACDIPLISQRVSRRHARFYTTGGQLHLEDLGSQNGVFVGGARIAGTTEIRPGPPIEIGDFKIRIKREDLQAPENMYAGTMQGLDAMDGKTLNLPVTKGVVGREETADISVPNDSVSRQHAEIRNGGTQGFFVTDLGSSNGTWLNGTKLPAKAERPLRPNDRIQFGDTAWLVAAKSAVAVSEGAKSAQRSFVLTLLVLAAVTGGVVWYLLKGPGLQHSTKGPSGPEEHVSDASPWDRCQASISDQKWSDAERSCGEAYEVEPFREKRAVMRKVRLELAVKEVYDDATRMAEAGGHDREAVERYFQIDTKSSYFLAARLRVAQLAAGLMKSDNNACHDAARQRKPENAVKACTAYLRFQCHNGIDKDALKILELATSGKIKVRGKKKGKDKDKDKDKEKETSASTFVCPPELAPWFSSGVKAEDERKTYCAPKYPDKDVCDGIILYAKSPVSGKDLLRAAQAFNHAPKGSAKEQADKLAVEVRAISDAYKNGNSSTDFAETERLFVEALAKDAGVMQPGVESNYAKDMKDKLAEHYLKAGDDAKAHDDLPSAFAEYVKGAAYRNKLNTSIGELEKLASDQLSKGPECPTLRKILSFTRDNSPAHKDADKRVHEKNCPP